jgi:hypothetical protein
MPSLGSRTAPFRRRGIDSRRSVRGLPPPREQWPTIPCARFWSRLRAAVRSRVPQRRRTIKDDRPDLRPVPRAALPVQPATIGVEVNDPRVPHLIVEIRHRRLAGQDHPRASAPRARRGGRHSCAGCLDHLPYRRTAAVRRPDRRLAAPDWAQSRRRQPHTKFHAADRIGPPEPSTPTTATLPNSGSAPDRKAAQAAAANW